MIEMNTEKMLRKFCESKHIPKEMKFNRGRKTFCLLKDKLGITDEHKIIMFCDGRTRIYNLDTFLMKPRLNTSERKEIEERLFDFLLYEKQANGTLRAKDILKCRNAEIRSRLLQQYGYEKLVKEVQGQVVSNDGESRLIDVMAGNERLRFVKVRDSTTKKVYVLRVPPFVKNCREAIAWTFGLSVEEYNPIKET